MQTIAAKHLAAISDFCTLEFSLTSANLLVIKFFIQVQMERVA